MTFRNLIGRACFFRDHRTVGCEADGAEHGGEWQRPAPPQHRREVKVPSTSNQAEAVM
jgi:hypothetical protein